MFVLGAFGFVHELLVAGVERPFVLALCGALMGLPFVLSADDAGTSPRLLSEFIRKNSRKDAEPDDEERWSHLP